MKTIMIRGRKVVGGHAKGTAIVSQRTISGWGGTDPYTGEIIDGLSDIHGENFAGKVLVFQGAKGSSGWSCIFHLAKLNGKAPMALIFNEVSTKVILGAVVMDIPAITDLEQDPLEVIDSGDIVEIFADEGYIVVQKREENNYEKLT